MPTRTSPSVDHYPRVVRMKAEMAMTHAQSRRNSYAHKYNMQLNTDCALLRRMLDHQIDATVSETQIQTDNIVDLCVLAEDNM
jgi:hypothetical protein